MRNFYYLLFIAFIFIGCEPVTESLDSKQIYFFDVNTSDWTESKDNNGLNRYYLCKREIKGLKTHRRIYEKGAVMVYLAGTDFQQPLPITRHFESDKGQRWTRTIDYEFSKGKITFFVTTSDFIVEQPESMSFRVVLMW